MVAMRHPALLKAGGYLRRNGVDLATSARLLVGFSGGADSLATLLMAKAWGPRVQAVHFEHGLRGAESRADAAWAEARCAAEGVAFLCLPLDVPGNRLPGEGVEAAARRLRLAQWRRLAMPDDVVLLGHHADDLIENLVLRLARGSNASGLSSLRPLAQVGGVRFVRPLLCLRKAEVLAFLRESGHSEWREDSSNQEDCCRRNLLRRHVLPELFRLLPDAAAGIMKSVETLRDDAGCLDRLAAAAHAEALVPGGGLSVAALRGLEPALLCRVMRLWLGEDLAPGWNLLKRLQRELGRDGQARLIPLGGGRHVRLGGGALVLGDDGAPALEGLTWDWRTEPQIAWGAWRLSAAVMAADGAIPGGGERAARFDLKGVPCPLLVRQRRPGDRMTPFGAAAPVRLKKLFNNLKAREDVPLVCAPDGTVLWLAGLRRSDFAPVGPASQGVLVFRLEDAAE